MGGINVIYEMPSKKHGKRDPKAEVLNKLSCTKDKCGLRAFDFHCVGGCTGYRMKEDADTKGLCELINAGRKFVLSGDPLEEASKNEASNARRPLKRILSETKGGATKLLKTV